jgi:hypothetical protein
LLYQRPRDELALIALSDVEEIGLLEVQLVVLADLAAQILNFDRDSLVAAHTNLDWGLVAQRFEEDHDLVNYQIESWGL